MRNIQLNKNISIKYEIKVKEGKKYIQLRPLTGNTCFMLFNCFSSFQSLLLWAREARSSKGEKFGTSLSLEAFQYCQKHCPDKMFFIIWFRLKHLLYFVFWNMYSFDVFFKLLKYVTIEIYHTATKGWQKSVFF